MKRPATNYPRFIFALLLMISFLAVSADAKHVFNGKIAFTSDRNGHQEVFVMNENGTNPVQLTNTAGLSSAPAWSPDGKKIAFGTNRDGNVEIYVMNEDGSNQTRLTVNTGSDNAPAWSPDGTHIAFHTNRDGNFEIYAMNADGSGATRLTTN